MEGAVKSFEVFTRWRQLGFDSGMVNILLLNQNNRYCVVLIFLGMVLYPKFGLNTIKGITACKSLSWLFGLLPFQRPCL